MPTLHETQDLLFRSIVAGDDAGAATFIFDDGLPAAARLNVYRNTFIGTLTTALRLSYPAVYRLVGSEFFESAARIFIGANPPGSAYLDLYGSQFPAFLARFAPAAALTYLPGIAQLEWAVNTALHAPDVPCLDLSRLSALGSDDHGRVVFLPHPALGLLKAAHPVDEIWRAVLAQDGAAMAAIFLESGPVWLLVDRREAVEVQRMDEPSWRFMSALCAGCPLQAAIDAVPEIGPALALAGHLAAGRFIDFRLIARSGMANPREALA